MRNKIKRIISLKSKRKLVCLTAYSKPIAKILDNHCDMILVGDSMATAFYGMDNTKTINSVSYTHLTLPTNREV